MAIGIKVKKAEGVYDPAASKFFGSPAVPLAWDGNFYDDEIFFCQIRLSDIAHLDREGVLPHTGYLYVFLHTEGGDRHLEGDVRYFDGDPSLVVDDFNAVVEGYEGFCDAYLMEFYETEDESDCTRLLGFPSDWSYGDRHPRLLMQYDPLDNGMGFLDHIDGYLSFFFGDDERNFGAVTVQEEYS